MMLTPDYLTTNQSVECLAADHAPETLYISVFKNLSLKCLFCFVFRATSWHMEVTRLGAEWEL